MTDTPRTDRAGEDGMYSTMVNNSLGLELKLNKAIKELTHLANLIDAHFENGGTIAGLGTTNKARQIIEKSKP